MTRVVAIWSVRAANTSSGETTLLGPLVGRGLHEHIVRASFRLDTDRANGRSVVKVVTLYDVCDQCRPLQPPSQPFLGQCARRRDVGRHVGGEEAEVGVSILSGDADNWQLHVPADSHSDFPEW